MSRGLGDQALRLAALTVLLDRAGGSISFTEAEYQAIVARHGGRANTVVRIEVVRRGETTPTVEVSLRSKPPRNAELVS